MTYLTIARVDLGMCDREFWRLTPARFARLVEAVNNRTMAEDYRSAIITCTMRRMVGDKKAEIFDEFPAHRKRLKKGRKGQPAPSEIRARMKAFIAAKESVGKVTEEKGG